MSNQVTDEQLAAFEQRMREKEQKEKEEEEKKAKALEQAYLKRRSQ